MNKQIEKKISKRFGRCIKALGEDNPEDKVIKEFDEEFFPRGEEDKSNCCYFCLRKFILKALAQQRKEIKEVLEKNIKLLEEMCQAEKHHPYETNCTYIYKIEALEDAIKKL